VTPMSDASGGRHLARIDAVRGFAALTVALMHIRLVNWVGMREYWTTHRFDLSISSALAYLSFPLIWGYIGVPIFFVISGYVIHRGSKNIEPGLVHGGRFLVRRIVRIYPTFIAAMLITWYCDSLARSNNVSTQWLGDTSALNASRNLAALVGIVGTPFGSNLPLWTLAIEIQFYAVYPLALIAWRWLGPEKMLLATLLLGVAGYLLLHRHGLSAFPLYYFSWWLGAYVADKNGKRPSSRLPLFISVFLLLLGCGAFLARFDLATHNLWSIGFAILLWYMLNANAESPNVRPEQARSSWVQKALQKCGDFSYSLYAVHMPIVVLINFVLFDGLKKEGILLAVLPALAATLLVSYLVYRCVEVPSIRMLKRLPR